MLNYKDIKDYWNNRAKNEGQTLQSTTNDYYLREIELDTLYKYISELIKPKITDILIGDIGCGDGYITSSLAAKFTQAQFYGYDYSSEMIKNAKSRQTNNCFFDVSDVVHDNFIQKFDILFTTRCLINLPNISLQKQALEKIYNALKNNGHYFMIENFEDGQNNFNQIRKFFDLEEIPVRNHNLFFSHDWLDNFIKDKFEIIKVENISSIYYLVSRIVYSAICKENGESPDYFDIHHKIACKLPQCGNFGPVKLMILKKKQGS